MNELDAWRRTVVVLERMADAMTVALERIADALERANDLDPLQAIERALTEQTDAPFIPTDDTPAPNADMPDHIRRLIHGDNA